jgi:hypothetical protein
VIEHLTRQRLVGSAAALAVLFGTPMASYLVALGSWWWLGAICGAVGLLLLGLLAGRLLWARGPAATAPALLGAGVLAVVAAIASFLTSYAIAIDHSLCGEDGWSSPTEAGVALVVAYGVIGVWGFQKPRRLVWAWPVAVMVAFAISLAITAALPSGHGYCET